MDILPFVFFFFLFFFAFFIYMNKQSSDMSFLSYDTLLILFLILHDTPPVIHYKVIELHAHDSGKRLGEKRQDPDPSIGRH